MQFLSAFTPQTKVDLQNREDIDANRRGEITQAQNERLNSMATGRQGCGTLFIPFIVLGAITFGLLSSLSTSNGLGWFGLIPVIIVVVILLAFSKGIYTWLRNSTRLRTDRANNLIRSGVGELTFSPKSGFTVKVNDEDLIIPAAAEAGGLIPGIRYNFYYLPESRFVLSAEQVGQVNPGQVRQALTEILSQANGFSPEDLQANKNGEVTQTQRMGSLKKLIPGLLSIGITLVFGIVFLYLMMANSDLKSNLFSLLFVGGFITIFVATSFTSVLNAIIDYFTHEPEMVEGQGSKITRRKSSGRSSRTVYYYVIGGREFEVPQKAFPALLEKASYRAYFMPKTNRLLAIEPISIPQVEAL